MKFLFSKHFDASKMGAYSDEESGFMFGAEREGIDSFQNMCNHYGVEED